MAKSNWQRQLKSHGTIEFLCKVAKIRYFPNNLEYFSDANMYDVNLKSVETNEADDIVRVIQTKEDHGAWSLFPARVQLPGREDAIITIDKNITVADVNTKLYRAFGFGKYYLGVIVNGIATPANGSLTMGYLNENNAHLAVVEEVWD